MLVLILVKNGSYFLYTALLWLAYSLFCLWPTPEIKGGDSFNAVIVGSGFSGIDIANKLKEAGVNFVILEKNSGLGGTWRDNIYPGTHSLVTVQLTFSSLWEFSSL